MIFSDLFLNIVNMIIIMRKRKDFPLCLNRKTYRITFGIVLAVLIVTPLFSYLIGYIVGSNSVFFHSTASISPTIDGHIIEDNWKRSKFIVKEYADVDNSIGNKDNYNYLYIGDSKENLYIGLDLLTDTLPNYERNWIGVLLNTDSDENLRTESDWVNSDTTSGIFFNLNTNETILNEKGETWNDGATKSEHNIVTIEPSIIRGTPKTYQYNYTYYDFVPDWYDGTKKHEDHKTYFIYAEPTYYEDIPVEHLPHYRWGSYSYMEFDLNLNITSLFPNISSNILYDVLDDIEINVEAGVIPYHYYDNGTCWDIYNYDKTVPYNSDLVCVMYLSNCIFRVINMNLSTSENYVYVPNNYGGINHNGIVKLDLYSKSDAERGHDSLLEDGVLKKSFDKFSRMDTFGTINWQSEYGVDVDWRETIEANDGCVSFKVYGVDSNENGYYGSTERNITIGFAFDYFSFKIKIPDSVHVSDYGYTTLNDVVIKHSHGSSLNSETPHKMIEIVIPKSELSNFNNEKINVMVVGYSGDSVLDHHGYSCGCDPTDIMSSISHYFGNLSATSERTFFNSNNYYVIPLYYINEKRFKEVL